MKKFFMLCLILILIISCTNVFASDLNQTDAISQNQNEDLIKIENQDTETIVMPEKSNEDINNKIIDNLSYYEKDDEISLSEDMEKLSSLSYKDYSVSVPKATLSYQKGGTIDCSVEYNVNSISGTGAEFYVNIYNSANSQVYSSRVIVDAFVKYASCNVNAYKLIPGDYTIKVINTKDSKNMASSTLKVVDSTDNSYDSFRGDVASVSSGETLYLDKNYVFEENLNSKFTINKEITIDGRGHVIDANKSNGILTIAADNVIIKNTIFKNVYSTKTRGGAIDWTGRYGKLFNCTFINNYAPNGGAVYWYSYRAEMANCTFINNSAINGGAYYQGYYSVDMSNCTFINNSASNNGGAMNLYAFQNNKITNFIFINNTAYNGGAIYSTVENGGFKISKSMFINNTASKYGGAVITIWSEIEDCVFNNNYAEYGGGISLNRTRYSSITNCSFNNNIANYGLAINLNTLCPISNSSFNGAKTNYNNYLYIKNKISPEVSVNVSDIDLGNILYVEPIFAKEINGKLTIEITNKRTKSSVYSSSTQLDGTTDFLQFFIHNLKSGRYILNTTYFGDNIFNSTSITKEFEVIGLPSEITFEVNDITWGDPIIINPKVTSEATGLIDIYVNGEYINTIPIESNYKLTNLNGPYSDITLVYLGDDFYKSCNHTERINVNRLNSTIKISEIESGLLSTVNITLNKDASGNISITFNGKKYNGNLINGSFIFNTTNLKSGNAYINILYEGDSKYNSFELKEQVEVILKSSPIELLVNNSIYGQDVIITPKVSGSLGKFEIYIDGSYISTIKEGNSYIASNLNLGKHTISVSYIDGVYYDEDEYLTAFYVYKKYPIEFNDRPIIYGSGERFYAKFYDEYGNILENKYVIFNINDNNYSARTDSNGIAYIPIELELGEYELTIVNPIVNEKAATNLLIFTSIESENMLVDKNTDFEFNAVFFDNDANELINIPIIFKINNEEKIINTNSEGIATLKLNLNSGTYEIYSTNTITNENKVNKILVVANVDSIISVEDIKNVNYNENAILKITVDQNYLNGNIEIKLTDDCNYEKEINITPTKSITHEFTDLDAGVYIVEVKYTNDDGIVFNSIKTFTVFKINPTINITAENIYAGEDAKITVKILNSNGNLCLKINDINYYEELNDGLLVKTISGLAIGRYVVELLFYGDNNYNSFDKNVTFNVYHNLDKEVIVPSLNDISDNEPVTITLPNDAKGTFTLTINGNNYTFAITNGKVDITIPELSNGNYNYELKYNGDNKYSPFTRTGNILINKILPTTISSTAITTVYNGNKYLVITLKDSHGTPINGAILTVILNGAKTITTDANGQAKLTTNSLAPKTYTATITFNGNNNYAKSTTNVKVTVKKATPKITAKTKTFKRTLKTKKYTITLKTNQNKVMKNTKVTIKINKKTYTAKTNSKGIATFKITKLTKKGTFKAVITYKGNTYYNKITKKVNIKCK